MDIGPHYQSNQKKIVNLTEDDWRVALAKCKQHIKWRLKQKTFWGAHSPSNLGADPVDHYLNLGYEKILTGEWEWKGDRSLSDQMIRIIDSYISKEVEKIKSKKTELLKVTYKDDITIEFYNIIDVSDVSDEELQQYKMKVESIERAINGDEELEFLWEAIKEGKKREEIAELLEVQPKQLDKLRERLFRRVRNQQSNVK